MQPLNPTIAPAQVRAGPFRLATWQKAALLGVGYFVCAEAGSYLSVRNTTYVSFWLPAGLYIAALLLTPTREWRWLMLAVLPANLAFDVLHGTNPLLVPFFYAANTLQSGLGAWLIRRYVAEYPKLTNLKELVGLIVYGAVLSTMLGAFIGAATLTAFGLSPSFLASWKVWWGSCGMAVLLFSPVMLTLARHRELTDPDWLNPKRYAEAVVLVLCVLVFHWQLLSLDRGIMSPNKGPLVLPLMWAGLRFGPRGAAVCTMLTALIMAYFTTQHFSGLTPEQIDSGDYVFVLQVTLAIAALLGLVPAIILCERDQNLARLHESEEHYRNLAAAAFEGISISENGRIIDANDQMLKMFGGTREQIVGQPIVNLVSPESRATVAEAIAAGRECNYEHRLLRIDGTAFDAEARARVVRIGTRTLRMTALRDITERKQAELALRESEEKFSKAFRAGPDAMSITDLETDRYLDVNEVHQKLFGYSREEIIGHSPAELGLVGSSVNPEVLQKKLTQEGSIRDVEIEANDRHGNPLTLLHSAELVQLHGCRCVLHVSHDITERKETERALRESELRRMESIQREQMARADYTFQLIASQEAERARIAGELHDSLGQNLLLIKNRAQLALTTGEVHPAAREQLEGIRDVATQSIAEVRQISHDLRPYQLDHLGLSRALETMIDQTGKSTAIAFTHKLDTVDDVFPIDATTNIYRIVQEGLNNIVKHSRAANARVELEHDIHHVRIFIKDDGRGFATAASTGEGTPSGLGLRNMIERARILRGSVKVESQPGAGTTIEVLIPLPEPGNP